jgi:MoxR-like ATPase
MAQNPIDASLKAQYEQFRTQALAMQDEIGKVIIGQRPVIESVVIGLLARGNLLLEGVPGLGKTLLVRTLSQVIDAPFSRIQFTPDLMPADIIGTNMVVEKEGGGRVFQFQQGPIFANVILADEINRATPKTQSAMLEAMQEHQVTAGGAIRKLPEPFFVLATQNPLEMEGTYPLPEAQLDRFLFKIDVPFPSLDELTRIADETTGVAMTQAKSVVSGETLVGMQNVARSVPVAPVVERYAARLILATHPRSGYSPEMVDKYVRYGASPRGVQALITTGKIRALLDGRFAVSCEDVRAVATAVLRHRMIMNFEGEAEGIVADAIVKAILGHVPETDDGPKKAAAATAAEARA